MVAVIFGQKGVKGLLLAYAAAICYTVGRRFVGG